MEGELEQIAIDLSADSEDCDSFLAAHIVSDGSTVSDESSLPAPSLCVTHFENASFSQASAVDDALLNLLVIGDWGALEHTMRWDTQCVGTKGGGWGEHNALGTMRWNKGGGWVRWTKGRPACHDASCVLGEEH